MARRMQHTREQDVSPFDRRPQVAPPYSNHTAGYTPYGTQPQNKSPYAVPAQYTSPYARPAEEVVRPSHTPEQQHAAYQQTEPAARHERRTGKPRRKRTSLIGKLLMIIGLITVLVEVGRRVIVPLLVYVNSLGGGAV